MKITIDARVLLDKKYSGVAHFAFYLSKNLLKIDSEHQYFFFYNSFKKLSLPDFIPKDKIIKTKYPNKVFNYLLQKKLSYPSLDKISHQADLFYSPHINFSSFSAKSKNIITIHDLAFLRYPEFFNYRKNFWHQALNLKKNLQNYHKIITVSQQSKRDLIDLLKIPEEKISVIYSGLGTVEGGENKIIKLEDFSEGPRKNLLSKICSQGFILYLGTIEPRKNIKTLISAFNLLKDQGDQRYLVLAGSWGWKTKEIKRKWQESKYSEDIIFLNYVDENLKNFLYQKADLFVYPSFYEGFGFPPLEALSQGLAVISSNTSSLPEVLGKEALLINPDKAEEIFQAIKLLDSNPRLKHSLIKGGLEHVKKFTWEKTAQEYLKIFNSYG